MYREERPSNEEEIGNRERRGNSNEGENGLGSAGCGVDLQREEGPASSEMGVGQRGEWDV